MALGIPTVASAVGTIHRIINVNENGILVNNNNEEWINSLSKLIEDSDFRKKLGNEAVKTVEDHYSINTNKSIYIEILRNVI